MELILSGLRLGLPLLFGVWGAILSVRVGLFNVALEGIITAGAFSHAMIWALLLSKHGWSPPGALLIAVTGSLCVGLIVGWLFGLLTARFSLDPIISGVALNMLILASVRILNRLMLEPVLQGRSELRMQLTSLKGAGINNPLALLTAVALFGTLILILCYSRTIVGRRANGVGLAPLVAQQVGISVERYRVYSSAFTGVACACAGVALTWMNGGYSNGLVSGRGYIALALALIGTGAISLVCSVAVLYGIAQSPVLLSELNKYEVPTQLLDSVPYWTTLLLLFVLGLRKQ